METSPTRLESARKLLDEYTQIGAGVTRAPRNLAETCKTTYNRSMSETADTKPMLDAIFDRLVKMEERLNIRLDRVEAEVELVHSEMLTLRADFNELKAQLREQLPFVK